MVKKLTLIFGGIVGFYAGYFKVFDKIEKDFNSSLRRVGPAKIVGKIGDVELECLFCINPIKDINYEETKKFHETRYKEIVPLPARELIKNLKSKNVLFFGLCGAFEGKKNQIYIPQEFQEIFFKEIWIKHKDILEIKPMNKIKIKNILSGKINGIKSSAITSNITLTYTCIENRCKDHLIEMAKILLKSGDIVDKEMYQIAKHFKKSNLGIAVMSSDVLSIKNQMLEDKSFNLDKEKFNQMVSDSIKLALKKIK